MGTRSTTKFYIDGKFVCGLYKQYDGYINGGWGEDLKSFIKSGTMVNGFGTIKKGERVFNGPEDMVLQLIAYFKTGTGGLYATFEDDKQEYNYTVSSTWNQKRAMYTTVEVKCQESKKYTERIKLAE